MVGSMVCFSNSQRLLRQARTPYRSINPVTASYGYLLNPQPVTSGQDALGLITIYPRPDEHGISAAAPGQRQPQPLYLTSSPSEPLIDAEQRPKTVSYPSLILP